MIQQFLIGKLTYSEVVETPNGKTIWKGAIVVPRTYPKKDAENKENEISDLFELVAFGDMVPKMPISGTNVWVKCAIHSRLWVDKEGNDKYFLSLVVNDVALAINSPDDEEAPF